MNNHTIESIFIELKLKIIQTKKSIHYKLFEFIIDGPIVNFFTPLTLDIGFISYISIKLDGSNQFSHKLILNHKYFGNYTGGFLLA